MSKNITYLFGAGASAHAIPVIDGIRPRINLLSIYLEQKKINIDPNGEYEDSLKAKAISLNKTLTIIINDLKWLYDESKNHQTTDTLAKKLYVQKNFNDLNRLKRALISFFFFEQHILIDTEGAEYNDLVDKRYDSLIASICQSDEVGNISLYKNVKILTWNYDLQIDLCLMEYSKQLINETKLKFNIFPNEKMYNTSDKILIDQNNFGVLKLNGNAYFEANQPKDNELSRNLYDKSLMHQRPEQIINKYVMCFESKFPDGEVKYDDSFKYFNFAWEIPGDEKYHGFKSVLNTAIEIAKKTDILIVVGYSFPFFNSDIDKAILDNLKARMIIIQDIDCDLIEQRMINLSSSLEFPKGEHSRFVHQKIGNYFPIPNEIK